MADGIASFGEKGPRVAERILAVSHLDIGRSEVACSQASVHAVRNVSKTDASTSSYSTQQTMLLMRPWQEGYWRTFERMGFEMSDTSHSFMLAVKNGCKGDLEVEKVQGIFLTNINHLPVYPTC